MKRFASVIVLLIAFLLQTNAQTTWELDRTHSNLDFSVRYMMLSSVRGNYTDFNAVLVQNNDDFSGSQIEVTINAASIDTRNEDRDNHLRSDDFFDAENYPQIRFVSREFERTGENTYRILGDLTIRGVTEAVELDAELVGVVDDPRGFQRVAFTGETTVNRNEFGVRWNRALEAGGFVVGDNVNITINAQFIDQS